MAPAIAFTGVKRIPCSRYYSPEPARGVGERTSGCVYPAGLCTARPPCAQPQPPPACHEITGVVSPSPSRSRPANSMKAPSSVARSSSPKNGRLSGRGRPVRQGGGAIGEAGRPRAGLDPGRASRAFAPYPGRGTAAGDAWRWPARADAPDPAQIDRDPPCLMGAGVEVARAPPPTDRARPKVIADKSRFLLPDAAAVR